MYTILSLSDSDKHFDTAISEYTKRLGKYLTLIDLKPNKADHKELAKNKDTDTVIARLQRQGKNYDHIILLSINATSKTTEDRVRTFPFSQNFCFIIGGPHGLDESKLHSHIPSLQTINLGKQTMVHGLAKLVLAEQIYRIRMIQQGRSYHY